MSASELSLETWAACTAELRAVLTKYDVHAAVVAAVAENAQSPVYAAALGCAACLGQHGTRIVESAGAVIVSAYELDAARSSHTPKLLN